MDEVQGQANPLSPAALGPGTIGRNALYKLVAEAVARSASLLVAVLAARRLGTDDFGVYSHALAVGLVVSQLADLGLQVSSAREVAMNGRKARLFVAHAFQAKCILSVPVTAILAVLAAAEPVAVRSTYMLLGLAMLAQTFLDFAGYVYRGQQNLAGEARLLAGGRILLAITATVVLWLGGQLIALALATVIPTALAAGYALRGLYRSQWLTPPARPEVDRSSAGGVVVSALPIGIAIFVSVAYTRLAILLLGLLLDDQAVAQFSAAQRLVEPWQVVPAAIVAAVFPAYSQALSIDRDAAARLGWRSAAGLALLGGALALALWLAAPIIIALLFTETFAASIPVLRVLALSIVPVFVNYALTHLLIGRGQQRLNLLFVGLMFVLTAGVSWRLIPTMGAVGAAIAMVAAELLLMLCCIVALLCSSPRVERPDR